MLEFLGNVSNYIGFWGSVLFAWAALYFVYRAIEWLADLLFGFPEV